MHCVCFGKRVPRVGYVQTKASVDTYINKQDARGHQQKELAPSVEIVLTGPEEVAPSNKRGSQVVSSINQTTQVTDQAAD